MDYRSLMRLNILKAFRVLGIFSKVRASTMSKDDLIKQIHQAKTCQIKVGETHGFRDIWVVVVNERLFCRQYAFHPKSWRSALLEGQTGYLKVSGTSVAIEGQIPSDLAEMMQQVNDAYLEKYVERLNYYPEIAKQAALLAKHQNSTVELVLKASNETKRG